MSNKKKVIPKAKEPIKIRFKKLANGNKSIYLDFYKDGQRQYEFLKLYLIPENSPTAKEANTETLRLANAIKAQKIVELQNTTHGFSVSSGRSKMNVIDYILTLAEKKQAKTQMAGGLRKSHPTYLGLMHHLKQYAGDKITFKQIDKKFCSGFIEYLRTAKGQKTGLLLNENTIFAYMKSFEAVINSAIVDEATDTNPFKQIKQENKPKKHKIEVVYLTINELKQMENTEYLSQTKQAFLFACYTGLRISDVQALTWGKLQKDNNGDIFINYRQKKTKKQEYLPIPQKAIEFLPDRTNKADNDKVFDLKSNVYVNAQLQAWAGLAGIKKHITFHIARHTYATLLLSLGAGIEIISKNLGHSEIRTTQAHYSAIENKLQRQAVNLLDKI